MTKRTTRAKPLKASNSHELSHEPAMSISYSGYGIAGLAQELADLQDLCIKLANAEGPAERARDDIQSAGHTRRCRAINLFADVGRRANGLVKGLEQVILGMEPKTPGETLSLTLVLANELDVFLSNHTDRNDCAVNAEKHRLEGTLQAIIRGLVYSAGATSPLTKTYSCGDGLLKWDAARSTAVREAATYLAGDETEATQ